ncbi:Intramolecular chaperone auto-processing domain containing protein, partial [uncultured Caudovirales phage]
NISEGTNLYYTDARARLSNSAGTGISYNSTSGVITNSAPDQTVSLTASTGISTSGTYPSFTITNTAPDQTVALTSGTGISATGTYPNFTITNTAPDQTVALTQGGTTTISGTYPNFTISSADQYVGTVTSVGITESSAALSITGSPVTTSGNINIGFAGSASQYVAGDGSLVTFPSIVSQAENLVTEVYNSTGATLSKGTIVYINGGQGNLPTVTKALASADTTSAQTYGVVQTDITNMNNGYVIAFGSLGDLDTQAYAAGTQLYLSGTTAGAWTSTKPYAPIHLVYVAVVTRSHPTQGVVEVRIQNGYEMDELHDVSAQSPSNGDILQYVSSTSLWTKTAGTTSAIAEGTNLYYTDARSRAAISLTTTSNSGASTYNNTTGILNVPTYTLAGLGGINLSSLSATSPLLYDNTTGVFSIQQSSDSQAGYLSSADWTTFNSKQGAITLTTTGSSGASTLVSNTLNIPTYTLSGLGGVPTSRTLSINGTSYDLSADRSWTIPTAVNATFTQDYTATAAQTTFTVIGGYTVGQLAVYYNGSKLASAEFTATNGTTFVLATACQVNDIVQAVVEITGGGIGGSGTTNYHSKWTASGVLGNSLIWDNGTNVGIGNTNTSYTLDVSGSLRNTTSAYFATTSGSVGIGTTSPSYTLDVYAASGYAARLNGSSYGGLILANAGTANTYMVGESTLLSIEHIAAINLRTNNADRVRITSAGNVGIGTSSPTSKVTITDTGVYGSALNLSEGGLGAWVQGSTEGLTHAFIGNFKYNFTTPSSSFSYYSGTGYGIDMCDGIRFFSAQSNVTNGTFTPTERMRITSGGALCIGTTSADGLLTVQTTSGTAFSAITGSSSSAAVKCGYFWHQATSGDNQLVQFFTDGGTQRGSIFYSRGSNQLRFDGYAASTYSDKRLKNIKGDCSYGLDTLSKIKVYDFDWLRNGDKGFGVVAQELYTLIPEVIEVGNDSEINPQEFDYRDIWRVNYGELVPVLIKSIQEQQTQIQSLQEQINILAK